INNLEGKMMREKDAGINIFIGHGKSKLWLELKDFIKDKLHQPYDEFNRVSIAGVTNITRLNQMLEQAAFAFILMTAEDETQEGKVQARMNVIHEAGLFQGKLGFERAIILLEDGCEEFSNINGLGQIRFPKGNISAVFQQIREVLERENIIEG
ncbi:TIR domain-containing protein, partial [Citrobacter freundii]